MCMQFFAPKSKNTILNILREAGYGLLHLNQQSGEYSFSRRLGVGEYPRFHVYAKERGGEYVVTVHIDQKKASYQGHTAHSGDYDSELVDQECNRLKLFLKPQ